MGGWWWWWGGGGGWGWRICKNVIIVVVITYCKGSIANIKEPISSPTKTATGIAVYTIRDEPLITSVIVYNLGPGESRTSQATKLILMNKIKWPGSLAIVSCAGGCQGWAKNKLQFKNILIIINKSAT